MPSAKRLTPSPCAQSARFARSSPNGLPSARRLAATPGIGFAPSAKTPYSVAIRRNATPDSICLTSRGQICGHLPQVVQRQMSSLSISVRPKVASRTILRMLKFLTLFQGQTVSHMPHW